MYADRVDLSELVSAYYTQQPSAERKAERVAFGTSGHRGSSFSVTFNEAHILAIAQAVCDYRKSAGIGGPLYVGKDTHALSTPAWISIVEVLSANGVATRVDAAGGYTPTPAISFAILEHNRSASESGRADGLVITPSHNPPSDGGVKYNPPHGGPAEGDITRVIERAGQPLPRAQLKRSVSRAHHPRPRFFGAS